jgi:cytochrome c oxidase subunit IV
MAHLTLEEGKKVAVTGFILLLVITVAEVIIALVGNGHIVDGLHFPKLVMIPIMCILSFYKAYYIVKEFMHLGHETRGMAASIVLPTLLLVWAIIAFLWEGDAWRSNRDYVKEKNQAPATEQKAPETKPTGAIQHKTFQLG